jgi:hypothetical protein
MNATSFKKRPVSHYRFLHLTRVQRQTTIRDLFSVDVQCKVLKIIMRENYGFVSMEPRKCLLFTTVDKRLFGVCLIIALSMECDCVYLENVNDLGSTLVMLYLATPPLLRTVL